MRLELCWFDVEDAVATSATRLSGHRLDVDLDALRALLSDDARLAGVRLDLVRPGERCRIGRVFDVVAPRAKPDGWRSAPSARARSIACTSGSSPRTSAITSTSVGSRC
jgi:hypothetical protein